MQFDLRTLLQARASPAIDQIQLRFRIDITIDQFHHPAKHIAGRFIQQLLDRISRKMADQSYLHGLFLYPGQCFEKTPLVVIQQYQ